MILASQTLGNAFTTPIRANTNLRIALRAADETQSEEAIGSREAAHIPSGPSAPAAASRARASAGWWSSRPPTSAAAAPTARRTRSRVPVRARRRAGRATPGASDRRAAIGRGDRPGAARRRRPRRLRGARRRSRRAPPWLPPLLPAIRLADLPPLPSDGAGGRDRARRRAARAAPVAVDLQPGGLGLHRRVRRPAAAGARPCCARSPRPSPARARRRMRSSTSSTPAAAGSPGWATCRTAARCCRQARRSASTACSAPGRAHRRRAAARSRIAGVSTLAEYRRRAPRQPCPQVTLLDRRPRRARPRIRLGGRRRAAGAAWADRHRRPAGRRVGGRDSRVARGRRLGADDARRAAARPAHGLGRRRDRARRRERPGSQRAARPGARHSSTAAPRRRSRHIGDSPEGSDQLDALRELAAWAAARWPGAAAPPVRTLPDRIGARRAARQPRPRARGHRDRRQRPARRRASTSARVICSSAARAAADGRWRSSPSRMRWRRWTDRPTCGSSLPDDRRCTPSGGGASVVSDPGACTAVMAELAALVAGRSRGAEERAGDRRSSTTRGTSRTLRSAKRPIASPGWGPTSAFISSAAVDKTTARGFTHPWVRVLANDGRGLVLAPEDASAADHLGGDLPRRSPVPRQPGRGYLIRDGSVTLIQIAAAPVASTAASG